jgi:hypothetical protein
MKTRTLIAAAAVALAIPPSVASAAAAPHGTYRGVVPSPLPLAGAWTLDFQGHNETVTYKGAVVVQSEFTISGNKITFDDQSGPDACSVPGVYKFKLTGKKLNFTLLSDSSSKCSGRELIFSETFTRVG